jgi:tetratricopeptide (TPR) repeat protein
LLGEACLGLDGLDAAMYYYEEAVAEGGDYGERAQGRIEELRRRDTAEEAVDEGVEGEDEAEPVLRAGEDALGREDYDTAWRYFSQAYEGIQMTSTQISRAAVGMAACHLNASGADEAEGYLQVAEQHDAAGLEDRISELRSRISDLATGDAAAADGVERDELDELNTAALAAGRSHDFEAAFGYFEQMYESGRLPGTDQGRVAYNMGIACLYTHDYDAAHQYLTEAANTARPEHAERANEFLQALQDADDASEIVARIDPDRDLAEE